MKYYDQHVCLSVCMSVRLFVCLYVCLSVCLHISKNMVHISPNFLHMLRVAVAGFSYDGSAMLSTSGFVDDVVVSYNDGNSPNQKQRVCFV